MALSSTAIVQVEDRMEKAALMVFEFSVFRHGSQIFQKIFNNHQKISQNSKKKKKKPRGLTKLLNTTVMRDPILQKSCCPGDAAVIMGEILWIFCVIFLAQISNTEII